LLGIVAGIIARLHVAAEGKTLDKGEDALTGSLPSLDLDSTDPFTWLASNDLPKDSHFGDHLLSVWCGWLGERVPTLAELHSLSARRERRRLSARISGGITALLLICGIAGTLLCIHPILQAFTIPVNSDNEVLIDPLVAQKLIRSLGSAFLPSLMALVATVLVAILRGVYIQSTAGLAWRLDRFAVAQLFPKFKPKRFGSELTEVHLKLARLVDRLDERDQKFGEGVGIFSQAALDLKEAGPKMKAASDLISKAADRLASETASMTETLDTHLGEDSALVKGTNSIKDIMGSCLDVAKQLREGNTSLANSLIEAFHSFEDARKQLRTSVGEIPEQIQQGCDLGSKNLIDSAAKLDLAHTRINTTVAGIPALIQQGCELGSKTLIEANQRTTQDAAAAIFNAAESAVFGINSAVANVQKDIQTGCANAGEVLTSAAKEASKQAVTEIEKAASEAAVSVKTEVVPISQVATEMRSQMDAASKVLSVTSKDLVAKFDAAITETGKRMAETLQSIKKLLDRKPEMEGPPRSNRWKKIVSFVSFGIVKRN
jgi:predicted  nucleic acid-binding Zn-ribbon protein